MGQNPLQQYFRQPKIYIQLPSMGVYNHPNSFEGDVSHMPVYGMTGMDEILMKTPDALMAGESTVKVIQSCCPSIKDAWDLSALDQDLVLIAIRIATYGNKMDIKHNCEQCKTENEYSVDLTPLVDYFNSFRYNNKISVGDLTFTIRPLNYRQSTNFSLKNFSIQQQLAQAAALTDKEEQTKLISNLFTDLNLLQVEVFSDSIESIQIGTMIVSEKPFIEEWLKNCDSEMFNSLKTRVNQIRDSLILPPFNVVCENCGADNKVAVDLDQSTFFEKA